MPRRPLYASEDERRMARSRQFREYRARRTNEQRARAREMQRERRLRMDIEQRARAREMQRQCRSQIHDLNTREILAKEVKRASGDLQAPPKNKSGRVPCYAIFNNESLDSLLEQVEFGHLNILHGYIPEFEIDDIFTEVHSQESGIQNQHTVQVHLKPPNSNPRPDDPSKPPNLKVTVSDNDKPS